MGRPMGPLRRYKYHLIEFFFSAITPSSSGGQPFEVLFMRADGYKVTDRPLTNPCVQAQTQG